MRRTITMKLELCECDFPLLLSTIFMLRIVTKFCFYSL